MCIPALMRTKFAIIMLARFRGGYEFAFLTDVIGASHANEPALFQIVLLFGPESQGVDEYCEVMGIAAHHLNKLILAFDQCFVVDPAGVHFAETVFTALGDKAAAVAGVLVIDLFFILVTNGGA